MDYRESTGVGKSSSSMVVRRDISTGATAEEDEPTITIDTEEVVNRFIVAVIGGVASAAVTKIIFDEKE